MPLHAAAGIECRVNYEFREADTIARRASWTDVPGVYLGEQVKSNGVYGKDKDGVRRRKPNNSSQYTDGGGVAQFASCTGYGTMAMIFVKSRFKDMCPSASSSSSPTPPSSSPSLSELGLFLGFLEIKGVDVPLAFPWPTCLRVPVPAWCSR